MRVGLLLLVTLVMVLGERTAEAVTIGFDALTDLESVSTQFPGLAFTNAMVLTDGISLNGFELPPASGVNVVFDDGGPMSIVFDELQASVGGFFTYLVPVTFSAFDALSTPVGTDTSDFGSNLALSGDPGSAPNEFLGLVFAGGINSVTIEGDPFGNSFTLDDLTFSPLVTAVPESATLLLLGAALAGVLSWRCVKRFRSCV